MLNDMVNYDDSLNDVFFALSDPTRRAILQRLSSGEYTVSELAEPFQMSLPAISKHLRILTRSGLIKRRIDGRNHYLSLVAAPMQPASQWLQTYQQFWDNSFDALARLIEEDEEPSG